MPIEYLKIAFENLTLHTLKGVPLEYVQNQNGMEVKLTTNKISKEAVDNKMFDVPSDYNIMSIEEAIKMIPKN